MFDFVVGLMVAVVFGLVSVALLITLIVLGALIGILVKEIRRQHLANRRYTYLDQARQWIQSRPDLFPSFGSGFSQKINKNDKNNNKPFEGR